MDDVTFDRLTRLFGSSQPRRGAIRNALGLVFGGAVIGRNPDAVADDGNDLADEAFAGGRGALDELGRRSGERRRGKRERDQRERGKSGQGKQSSKDKEKNKKSCAESGQKRKRGKPCCKGLVKSSSGFCAQPASSSCAATCAGCCDGNECITDGSGNRCGANGELCAPCATSCAATCTGCCDGEVCVTDGGGDRCGADGEDCGQCPCEPNEIRCSGLCDLGNCCNGMNHETCDGGITCCGSNGCKDLQNDENFCGSCTNACTGRTDTCEGGVCKCGSGPGAAACALGERCEGGSCVCDGPEFFECDGVCQTCVPDSLSSQRLSSDRISVQDSHASCCSNAEGQEFCSCGGTCCEGHCFTRISVQGQILGEFCCQEPNFIHCVIDEPLDKREICCECSGTGCPTCEACLALSPNEGGRVGAVRRPGR